MKRVRKEFLRFCLVGGLGFVIDAGVTLAMTWAVGASALVARVPAFLIAATATWLLHARFTFSKPQRASSWLRYVLLTAVGALINLVTYLAWLEMTGIRPLQVVLGVAAGSAVALTFNFFASRRWIFN